MGLTGGTLSRISDCSSKELQDEVLVQSFSVPFSYNVHFTNRALALSNRVLVNAICLNKTSALRRVFAVVDDGLSNARPGLQGELRNYFHAHRDSMRLVAPPLRVPGGKGKDEPALAVTDTPKATSLSYRSPLGCLDDRGWGRS